MPAHDATAALVVEDHPLYREALVNTLLSAGLGLRCHAVALAGDARRRVQQNGPFGLVLADQRLPDGEGLGLLAELTHGVTVRVLLSGVDDPRLIRQARALGINAYLSKALPSDQMVQVLRRVMAGETWYPPQMAGAASRLTDRQMEVLQLVGRGRSNREIAARLGVGERTVKDHLSLIFVRLGAANRAEAVAQASALGLIEFDTAD
ncbi:MAG: response regulator transcription factor [Rhizobacter sp.]|nr:response regulator transcription factor [Rhizobacter sp.]